MLYAMLQGTVPFKAANMKELHEIIVNKGFTFPVKITDDAKDLISKMLVVNPPDWLSIPEILSHSWLKDHESDEEDD